MKINLNDVMNNNMNGIFIYMRMELTMFGKILSSGRYNTILYR